MGAKGGIPILGSLILRRILLSAPAFCLISACLLLLFPSISHPAEVTIAWSPSADKNVAGYKFYYGPTSRDDQFQGDAGKNISITITNLLAGGTYSFVALTYDSAGRESRYSNKATISNLRDKDDCFLPAIPSSSLTPPSTPLPEKSSPDPPPGYKFSALPASQTIGSSGGWGTVEVSTRLDCSWTAAANLPWLTAISKSSGAGCQVVSYLVKANSNPSPREGTLTLASQTFKIDQTGLARHTLNVNKVGTGTGTVASVPAGADCRAGTVAMLSAAPSANSYFAGWSGRSSGDKPACGVTIGQ